MSRAETLYASAYDTVRMHEVSIRAGGRRPIRIELNGVLPSSVTVISVDWNVQCQGAVTIDTPAVASRSFSAWLVGVNEGNGEIEARATLSDGSVSVQRISVRVLN